LTLLGIDRLALAIERFWGRPEFDRELEAHEEKTLRESDATGLLIAALYASFSDFEMFATLSLLYFASASYAEAARRLGRSDLAGSFLSGDHPVFGPAFRECCAVAIRTGKRGRSDAARATLIARVRAAIEPLDVAGFSDLGRRRWHPMEAAPLLAAAHKLGATTREIESMLERSGFWKEASSASLAEAQIKKGCYSQ
jgi:FADH2 O2-dependent halogenase